MSLHRVHQLRLGRTGGQLENRVQGVKLEKVAVRLAGGRRWAAVTNFAEVVFALPGLIGEALVRGYALMELAHFGRQIEQHPVHPDSPRGIRVVADEGEAPGLL